MAKRWAVDHAATEIDASRNKMNARYILSVLPSAVHAMIMNYLPMNDIGTSTRTCSIWRDHIDDYWSNYYHSITVPLYTMKPSYISLLDRLNRVRTIIIDDGRAAGVTNSVDRFVGAPVASATLRVLVTRNSDTITLWRGHHSSIQLCTALLTIDLGAPRQFSPYVSSYDSYYTSSLNQAYETDDSVYRGGMIAAMGTCRPSLRHLHCDQRATAFLDKKILSSRTCDIAAFHVHDNSNDAIILLK